MSTSITRARVAMAPFMIASYALKEMKNLDGSVRARQGHDGRGWGLGWGWWKKRRGGADGDQNRHANGCGEGEDGCAHGAGPDKHRPSGNWRAAPVWAAHSACGARSRALRGPLAALPTLFAISFPSYVATGRRGGSWAQTERHGHARFG
jgi:hypothetical protein